MSARRLAPRATARLELYTDVAEQAPSLIIRRYSTSFAMVSRLLGLAVRRPVENVYALVRVADEIVLDEIHAELALAARSLPLLPRSSRRAVALAHGLFAELSRRIRATPAAAPVRTRVRVPDLVKFRIALVARGRTA